MVVRDKIEAIQDAVIKCRATTREVAGDFWTPETLAADDAALSRVWELLAELEAEITNTDTTTKGKK